MSAKDKRHGSVIYLNSKRKSNNTFCVLLCSMAEIIRQRYCRPVYNKGCNKEDVPHQYPLFVYDCLTLTLIKL